ncbi:thiamine-phosphate kinase [Murinocardiopsis flavida]|uniref:thiamine-phosphate kinase n=1 Tax=Murinocardiopsis flavida TaxID=645275 RepID=UPI000D0DD486|nr:thiamine-phosphate kinase [Murinocardiopsis flavida]
MSSTIGRLGEFQLIARMTSGLAPSGDVLLGPGDDAAVVRAPDQRVVASMDLLVEGRHFRRDWSSAHDVGRKAAAQNFADIAAMGARPTVLLVGFAAPADLPASWADGFTAGLRAECAAAGGTVAGGDVVGADTVTIAVTALGDLEGRRPVRRDGARVGDLVAVTGHLGLSAAGQALLAAGIDGPPACTDEHRHPAPPYARGPQAADHGATAMLDVSDGLVQDLGHIAAASAVAIALTTESLRPEAALDDAVALLRGSGERRGAADFMLAGGEDHALAATFPPDAGLPPHWHPIGVVERGSGVLVDGEPAAVRGWDHFGQGPETTT